MRCAFLCLCLTLLLSGPARAENLLWVEDGSALPGTPDVSLGLYAKHDEVMHAFSAALRYEGEAFTFESLDLEAAGVVTGQVGYEYSQGIADNEAGTLIVAVVLDFDTPYDHQAIPASPNEEQLLARLVFSVNSDAKPGSYNLQLRNGLGSPPIENVFSVFGRSVLPERESGTFTVINPNHLFIRSTQATVEGRVTVLVEAEHTDPIGGFQIVVRYPSDKLLIDTHPLDDPFFPVNPEDPNDFVEEDLCLWPMTFCGLGLEDFLGTDGPGIYPIESYVAWAEDDFEYSGVTPGEGSGRALALAVFDFPPPNRDQTLPPGTQRILRITFEIVENAVQVDDVLPITLINGTGTPVIDNIYVIPVPGQPDVSVAPDLHSGTITIVEGFRRGYINADAKVDLADVIYLLTFLFAHGPEPLCVKAADSNDDGSVDIADAIKVLGYLFGGGNPPAAPFAECGGDPTPDNLTCDVSVGC